MPAVTLPEQSRLALGETMQLTDDFFALFEMPRAFRIDPAELERRYHERQAQVHPDRFASAGDAERRLSLQWATTINEAYQTLRRPLSRAKYLLQLARHDIASESNLAMPTDFLVEQMEWREAIAEARAAADHHELEHLHHRLHHDLEQRYVEVASLLDDRHDFAEAADRVRRLMFLEKLLFEIDEAIVVSEEQETG